MPTLNPHFHTFVIGASLAGLASLAALAGCGGDQGDGPANPSKATFTLLRVDSLVPGGIARLVGQGFTPDKLAGLTVEGRVASDLRIESDSVARFQVPELRACEEDGRPVQLVASGRGIRAPVRTPKPLVLLVGESRLLPLGELGCLQFPAGHEVLVHALSLSRNPAAQTLFRLRAEGDATGAAGTLSLIQGHTWSPARQALRHELARPPRSHLLILDPQPQRSGIQFGSWITNQAGWAVDTSAIFLVSSSPSFEPW